LHFLAGEQASGWRQVFRPILFYDVNKVIGGKNPNMTPKFMLTLIFSLIGLIFAASPAAAQSNVWTADYFNNANLSGVPVFTTVESSPSHDWGAGSPSAAIPVDFFSVRWTSVQTIPAIPGGAYQLSVRADDGVRVSVDGILYINEWHPSAGNIYNVSVPLSPGAHTFVVEYFEATGNAYLSYSFSAGSGIPPSVAMVAIAPPMLNVRDRPDPFTGVILTRVRMGEVYPVVGRNADSSWIQLSVNGITGWVNARYTVATNLQLVPITDPGTRPTGATATVTANFLNVRQTPDPLNGIVIARIALGQTFPALGRNADSSWVQLNVNGIIGWVNRVYLFVPALQSLPVVGSGSVVVTATVTANMLNVRAIPDPINGLILTRILLGQTYPVVGRNAAGTWVQLSLTNLGLVGWVNVKYVSVPSLAGIPITG
jgi:uncharacterized protein YraI